MYLGLDLGTTNVKALLAAADGRVAGVGSAPVSLLQTPDGGVGQDIEEIWSAAVEAVGQLPDDGRRAVRAVGVSAQGGAVQFLDPAGRPAGRVISWMDKRGAKWDEELTERLGCEWFARRIGHGRAGLAIGQVLRARSEGRFAEGMAVAFVGDIVVGKLCGRRAHDGTSLGLTCLHNPALRRADPEVLSEIGLRECQLPDLLPAAQSAGALLSDAAEALGLPPGVPVGPAVHDQYAAALGAGVASAGDAMLGTGTAWVLLALSDALAPPVVPSGFVCHHVVPGLYGQMAPMGTGGSAFQWLAKTLGMEGLPREELDSLVLSVPSGAEGVRFNPRLPAGEGALAGLRLGHEPRHLLRAGLEGLALELRRFLDLYEAAGVPVKRLAMTGGAAASRATPSIVADATRIPVEVCSVGEASALGAAILARALEEPGADLAELAKEMVPVRLVVAP